MWVAAARYDNGSVGSTNVVATLASGISLIGGFSGYHNGTGAQEVSYTARQPDTNVTILDGAGTAYHVILGATNSVLDGFTIKGGNANAATASDTDPNRRGAGLDNGAGNMTTAHCLFSHNNAIGDGGGIYNGGAQYIHDCRFYANVAQNAGAGGGGGGGAIYSASTVAISVDNAELKSNTAGVTGGNNYAGGTFDFNDASKYNHCKYIGNISVYGAAMESTSSTAVFRSCDFVNNVTFSGGEGAGFYDNWGNTQVYDSTFMNNSAPGSGSGGGLLLRDSGTLLDNCRVEFNQASNGAGIWTWDGLTTAVQHLVRVRIANNRATSTGGGLSNDASKPALSECVFEGNNGANKGGAIYNLASSPTISSSTFVNDMAASGPEIYNDVLGATTSLPTAVNTIISNHTFVAPPNSVFNAAGCSLTTTYSWLSDAGQNAQMMNIPSTTQRTTGASTVSLLTIANATTYFLPGDVVEVNDDGVARTVSAVAASSITIAPALPAIPALGSRVDDWGPGATNLAVDMSLSAASACIDAGNNAGVLADTYDLNHNGNFAESEPFDFAGSPRFVDDLAVTDTGLGTAPIVDIGAYEHP